MKSARLVTEGAVLLAVFVVLLLLTIYVPVISIIGIFVLPLPFILFAAKNDWKSTVVFAIASLLITMVAVSVFSILMVIPYAIVGSVMGYLIQKNKSRTTILLTCSILFLLNLVVMYIGAVALFHFNAIDETIKMMRGELSQISSITKSLGQQQNTQQSITQMEQVLNIIPTIAPSIFVLTSLIFVFIIQIVSLPILRRFKINVDNWKPFREISLPKSLLWYYLVISLISMFFHPQTGSYWSTALINLNYTLQILMFFQGFSFLYYFFYQKGISKSFPNIITAMVFLLPSLHLSYVVLLLGIIDLGFELRKQLKKQK